MHALDISIAVLRSLLAISGMDFFVVPTVRFRLLHVWFVLDHGRRRLLHFNVTESPTAAWVIQQLREAFPDQPSHRFLIFDNDAIFSSEVVASMGRLGIRPKRAAYRRPGRTGRQSASSAAFGGNSLITWSCSARIT